MIWVNDGKINNESKKVACILSCQFNPYTKATHVAVNLHKDRKIQYLKNDFSKKLAGVTELRVLVDVHLHDGRQK